MITKSLELNSNKDSKYQKMFSHINFNGVCDSSPQMQTMKTKLSTASANL